MTNYTPTTEEVRSWYVGAVDEYRCDTGMSLEEGEEAFDNWLAAHDREVAAQTLRETADKWQQGEWAKARWVNGNRIADRIASANWATDYMRLRATEIEKDES